MLVILVQHFITHHISQERIQCATCGNSFKNKNSLAAHVSSKHRLAKGIIDQSAAGGGPIMGHYFTDSSAC
jgi:hypothetical protein